MTEQTQSTQQTEPTKPGWWGVNMPWWLGGTKQEEIDNYNTWAQNNGKETTQSIWAWTAEKSGQAWDYMTTSSDTPGRPNMFGQLWNTICFWNDKPGLFSSTETIDRWVAQQNGVEYTSPPVERPGFFGQLWNTVCFWNDKPGLFSSSQRIDDWVALQNSSRQSTQQTTQSSTVESSQQQAQAQAQPQAQKQQTVASPRQSQNNPTPTEAANTGKGETPVAATTPTTTDQNKTSVTATTPTADQNKTPTATQDSLTAISVQEVQPKVNDPLQDIQAQASHTVQVDYNKLVTPPTPSQQFLGFQQPIESLNMFVDGKEIEPPTTPASQTGLRLNNNDNRRVNLSENYQVDAPLHVDLSDMSIVTSQGALETSLSGKNNWTTIEDVQNRARQSEQTQPGDPSLTAIQVGETTQSPNISPLLTGQGGNTY